MKSTAVAHRRSSPLMSPVNNFGADNSPLIRESSSSPDFTNPFFEAPTLDYHAHDENSPSLQLRFNPDFSYANFSDSPTIDSNSHPRSKCSLSTPQRSPSNVFSQIYSPDSFIPIFHLPITTLAASPPHAISSPFSHHTAFTTPARLGAFVSSPTLARSTSRFLGASPPYAVNTTPFQLFKEEVLPPLFDVQSSPVVRRSLGDVTPVYSHRDDRAPRGFFRAEDDGPEETDETPLSLSNVPTKQNTPFLQKLRRSPRLIQKQVSSHPSGTFVHTPSLASPFSLKAASLSPRDCNTPSCAPAQDVPMLDSSENLKTRKPCSEQNLPVSIFSSPLSESSTVILSHSPLPFNFDAILEEDRKHRMRTRSAARSQQDKTSAPVIPKRATKTSNDLKDSVSSARADAKKKREADIEASPPRKRRKNAEETAFPSPSTTRQILRKGAGPSTFSVKSRSKTDAIPSISNASGESASFYLRSHRNDLRTSSSEINMQRKFPPSVTINESFPRFYRKFPVSSFFYPEGADCSVLIGCRSTTTPPRGSANINKPRSPYDLYTPRFTQGIGHTKRGLCPICFESVERGGAGRQEWLAMKFSAYKCYHMQYFHGISSATGMPFSPPMKFRTCLRTHVKVNEKREVTKGKCHKCQKWEAVEGVKIGTVNVKEIFWWKHAALCHKKSTIVGEADIFIEDDVFRRLKEYEESSPVMNDVAGSQNGG